MSHLGWIETTGKSIVEAREAALDQLRVDESEAEFEIVQEPKAGLFGRTRGVARVRARVAPKTPMPKNDRRRKQKKNTGSGEAHAAEGNGAGKQTRSKGNGQKSSSQSRGQEKSQPKEAPKDKGVSAGRKKPESSESTKQKESGTMANGNDGESTATTADRSRGRAQREPMDIAEQTRVVEDFLAGLVRSFGVDATFDTRIDDKDLYTNIIGDGLGAVVGPRLATLEAVQELTRLALQREAGGKEYARVTVDASGIREERLKSLEAFVVSAAERVRLEGKTVVFEEMSSADRKHVHDLASSIDGVRSISEGEDPRRRVALIPAD